MSFGRNSIPAAGRCSNRRLIARELLSDEGVIFISIDDNEQAQLKLLCDSVFGEDNFIAIYKWNKTATAPSLSQKVRNKYEYIICYEKIRNSINYNGGTIDGGDVPLLIEIGRASCRERV